MSKLTDLRNTKVCFKDIAEGEAIVQWALKQGFGYGRSSTASEESFMNLIRRYKTGSICLYDNYGMSVGGPDTTDSFKEYPGNRIYHHNGYFYDNPEDMIQSPRKSLRGTHLKPRDLQEHCEILQKLATTHGFEMSDNMEGYYEENSIIEISTSGALHVFRNPEKLDKGSRCITKAELDVDQWRKLPAPEGTLLWVCCPDTGTVSLAYWNPVLNVFETMVGDLSLDPAYWTYWQPCPAPYPKKHEKEEAA